MAAPPSRDGMPLGVPLYGQRAQSDLAVPPLHTMTRMSPYYSYLERSQSRMEEEKVLSLGMPTSDPSPLFPETPNASHVQSQLLRKPRTSFQRIVIKGDDKAVTPEVQNCCEALAEAIRLREKWLDALPGPSEEDLRLAQMTSDTEPVYVSPAKLKATMPPETDEFSIESRDGVFEVRERNGDILCKALPVEEFYTDLRRLMDLISYGPLKSFCYQRLQVLEARFRLHMLLNEQTEIAQQKNVPHRDLYNVRKIDNHVHHSACMNQKHMLRFIKHKLRCNGNDVVACPKDTGPITLAQMFERIGMTAYDLSVDALDMRADGTFQRFDKFNAKYNPLGDSLLREVFMKFNNHIDGRYLAEITHEVFDDLESTKYQFAEYRLSIYGKDPEEWRTLAAWVVDHDLFHKNVRWMIQIPRLFNVYRKHGLLDNFGEMIDNVFRPLFEVTLDPSSNPKLHTFLKAVVGFDTVDDESIREPPYGKIPLPRDWTYEHNPPYSYWTYYIAANLRTLNALRRARGFTQLAYRPHSGEAGDVEHLGAAYMLAHGINHGIVLNESPALQYLYYLSQVGMSLSPLSNNMLFIEYEQNPFFKFFKRGLNVTLSTDDPLLIHVTKEPLVEEYSVAAQVWKLKSADLSEIARNSVLQSGFEHGFKSHWIGPKYYRTGTIEANDVARTNLPDARYQFRLELLQENQLFILEHCDKEKNAKRRQLATAEGSSGERKMIGGSQTSPHVGPQHLHLRVASSQELAQKLDQAFTIDEGPPAASAEETAASAEETAAKSPKK